MKKAVRFVHLFFVWILVFSVLPNATVHAKDKEKKNHIQSKQRKRNPKPLKLEAKKPKEKKETQTNFKLGQSFFLFNPLVTMIHFLKPTVSVVDTTDA